MVRNRSVSLLLASAAALGALSLSSGIAQACNGPYNDNRGYCTTADVADYGNNSQNGMDWVALPWPHNDQAVWAPRYMKDDRNFGWTLTSDQYGGGAFYTLEYQGPRNRPDRDGISCHRVNPDIDYGLANAVFVNGDILMWLN